MKDRSVGCNKLVFSQDCLKDFLQAWKCEGFILFITYLYFHVVSPDSFRFNRSSIIFPLIWLLWFCLLLGPLWQYCQAHQYVLLLQRKHHNVWQLWRYCLLLLNPIFLGMSLLYRRLSYQCWAQIILSSEMWALILKDSSHWLKAVTVLVVPTVPPPMSQFHEDILGIHLYLLDRSLSCSFSQPSLHSWMSFQLLRPGSGIAN